MARYDYREAVRTDIENYIEEHNIRVTASQRDELQEKLYDDMMIADSITGNASGSYTFSGWQAEENICHNLDLLGEALKEFGYENFDILEKGAESCDVIIRCYLLGEILPQVLDDLEEDDEDEMDEDETEDNED